MLFVFLIFIINNLLEKLQAPCVKKMKIIKNYFLFRKTQAATAVALSALTVFQECKRTSAQVLENFSQVFDVEVAQGPIEKPDFVEIAVPKHAQGRAVGFV